ncbi:TetR/AcrR family transcriptional regulator [Nocardiopsis coralliicola]
MEDPEAKPPRQQISADQRRERLLAAALRVMKRDGTAAATTRAICAEAGMPHGAFHYCFRSKSELYAELLASDIDIDLDAVWPEISPGGEAQESIGAVLLAYWSQIETDADAQLALFDLGGFALRDPGLRSLPGREYGVSLDTATRYIRRLEREAGLSFQRDARSIARLTVAALNGVAWSWLAHRDSAAARADLAQFAELLAALAEPADSAPQ